MIAMRVAVRLFGSRVSPRFDCAQVFLIATPDEGGTWQRQELSAADWAPHERINRLVAMGIDNLICGGIDWWSSESLLSAGILVFDSITGEADEALAAWRRGDLGEGRRKTLEGQVGTPPSVAREVAAVPAREAAEGRLLGAGLRRRRRRRGDRGDAGGA